MTDNPPKDGDWRLVPAETADVYRWSFGCVSSVAKLYAPAIFGARQPFRCECGKHRGEDAVDILCDICAVKVTEDVNVVRRERMGHLELAYWCEHPLSGKLIGAFPVAPIAFRISSTGSPNALGVKYELLTQLNVALAEEAEKAGDGPHISAHASDSLSGAFRAVLGSPSDGDDESSDTLLMSRLCRAMLHADPDIGVLLRSCGYAIDLRVRA